MHLYPTGRRLIICLAVGLVGCTNQSVGDAWDIEDASGPASEIRRYLVEIGTEGGIGTADVLVDDGEPFGAGELAFDVVGSRVRGSFQGLKDRRPWPGLAGFSVPLRGEQSTGGAFEITGNNGPDGARVRGHIDDQAITGTIGGAVLKHGYSIEFVATPVEPVDGTYPCRGYRCADHCDAENPCDADETCAAPAPALPQRCAPNGAEPPADPSDPGSGPWFVVLVSNPRNCHAQLVDGLPAPGVEIANIQLRDSEGEVIGTARSVSAQPGTLPNAFGYAGVFNGRAVLDSTCTQPAYSLGCEGAYLVVAFDDEHGSPRPLSDGSELEIEVLDCAPGDERETFDVLTCTDHRAVHRHDLGSCSVVLGSGLWRSATLTMP